MNRPLMVVGTPGRLGELSRAGVLQTHGCGLLILDEVDQLLAPQFAADVSRLAAHCGKRLPQGRQTIIASATINPQVPASRARADRAGTLATLVVFIGRYAVWA